MTTETVKEGGRVQSRSRAREGYGWASCVGLSAAALAELDAMKTEMGLRYRDDVVASVLGEVGLPEPHVRAGMGLVLSEANGGVKSHHYLPKELIAYLDQASLVDQLPLDRGKVLAAILMAVRPRFAELARAGFARKMALPAKPSTIPPADSEGGEP